MQITQEQFEEWREHPVTQEFFKILHAGEDQMCEMWLEKSWEPFALQDPNIVATHAQLTARAGVYSELYGITYEQFAADAEKLGENVVPFGGAA